MCDCFFFFKQKTAYEMRISDWSSDVCSSDLISATGNQAGRLLVAFEDVTEARLLERHKDILAAELSHRIKNSLQIIASFVHFELRDAPEPCIEGYQSMEPDRKSTRLNSVTNAHIVCRLLLEKQKKDEY